MHAVKAIWTNGRILPSEPVDWPEGSELMIERIVPVEDVMGLTEADWRDDPESIAAWEAGIRRIERFGPFSGCKLVRRKLGVQIEPPCW